MSQKKRRGNQNPFKFFFARMLLIPIQWSPELCAHRAKRSHTQIREITIDANQQTMGLQAGIQLKLSKKIPEDTKQSSTKWLFSLDSLSRSHILSLSLSPSLSAIDIQSWNWTIQPDTANDCGPDECWQYFAINLCISFSPCHWWSLLARVPFVQSPSGTGTVETLIETGVTL